MKNVIIAVLVTFVLCTHGDSIIAAGDAIRCQFQSCS